MIPADTGMTDALARMDRAAAAEALKTLIQRLLEGDYPSPAHLKDSVLYALVHEVKGNEALLRQDEASNFISEMEFQIPACESLEEVEARGVSVLNRIIGSIGERKKITKAGGPSACVRPFWRSTIWRICRWSLSHGISFFQLRLFQQFF
ncbi:hypothetical protein ACFSQ7_24840 [Paenibacillus rhizoplanae]